MVTGGERTDKLLVYSPAAGAVTEETPVGIEALAGGLHVILPA